MFLCKRTTDEAGCLEDLFLALFLAPQVSECVDDHAEDEVEDNDDDDEEEEQVIHHAGGKKRLLEVGDRHTTMTGGFSVFTYCCNRKGPHYCDTLLC